MWRVLFGLWGLLLAQEYYVTTTRLNLRKEPKIARNIIITLDQGDTVKVLEKLPSGWFKVEAGEITGFVYSKYLRPIPKSSVSTDKDSSSDTIWILGGGLFLLLIIGIILQTQGVAMIFKSFSHFMVDSAITLLPLAYLVFVAFEQGEGVPTTRLTWILGIAIFLGSIVAVWLRTYQMNNKRFFPSLIAFIIRYPLAFFLGLLVIAAVLFFLLLLAGASSTTRRRRRRYF